MQPYPHHYRVAAESTAVSPVTLSSNSVSSLVTDSPAEFGGPGDKWSPETLLVGAVGDCFNLTFRAIARASKLEWTSLRCDVTGVLDKPEGKTRFVKMELRATLDVPPGTDVEKARKLLQKAEDNCLITQSLNAELNFEADVRTPVPG